jgi:hypothetical protein
MALDLEALDIKIALNFRAFVLQSCTLYTNKKNEGHNRRPYFISRIHLIFSNGEPALVLTPESSSFYGSFILYRQRRKEGTFSASELAEFKPTPPGPEGQGVPAFCKWI